MVFETIEIIWDNNELFDNLNQFKQIIFLSNNPFNEVIIFKIYLQANYNKEVNSIKKSIKSRINSIQIKLHNSYLKSQNFIFTKRKQIYLKGKKYTS